MLQTSKPSFFLITITFVVGSHAQQIPDANTRIPEVNPRLVMPAPSPDLRLQASPPAAPGASGGPSFLLREVNFSGNTRLSTQDLEHIVAPYIGKQMSLSDLQALANALSEFYQQAGYPVARAYLPQQDVVNGRVRLEIVEGRFGEVLATMSDGTKQEPNLQAQAFLGSLRTGEVIEGKVVERSALIMNDIPGYKAVPILRPSAVPGAGDLEVRMIPDIERSLTRLTLDNHGAVSTGLYRLRLDHERARNYIFGDQLRLTALTTDGSTNMVYGAYSVPVLPNGLRLEINGLHSTYKLTGGVLAKSGFSGQAQVLGGQLSYPVVRSQAANLAVLGGLQRRWYTNEVGIVERYTIDSVPLSAQFDVRDGLAGGAVTYGVASWTTAHVAKDNFVGADREKRYSKINLDLARLQQLGDDFQFFAKFAGQDTQERIDATDFAPLAGPGGVRAYPVGEFSGHRATTTQLELRYVVPALNLTPYLFYDRGQAVNVTSEQRRVLSGHGVGLTYANAGHSVNFVLAWPRKGQPSLVEQDSSGPRIWATFTLRL